MNFLRRYPLLFLTLVLGVGAIFASLAGFAEQSRWVISVYGALIAVKLSIGMVRDIMRGHYGVDILAVVAILSTIAVDEYWATLVIVIMMLGGEALEDFASERARLELTALMERAPKVTRIKKAGEIIEVAIEKVKPGDLVVLSPGDIVPVDGQVDEGESTVDESSLTGESEPVLVRAGDKLMSGAVVGESALVMRASAVAADSQYAQIVQLVQAAGDSRAPFVRLADRYAVPFTLVAFAIAGTAWWLSGDPRRFAEVLVVATPCPLLLAAPIAMISGMSRSAKHGIILKSGAVLERLARVRTAAFDKTGTLTMNELSYSDVKTMPSVDSTEFLQLAASVEQYSVHNTARAILAEAKRQKLKILPVQNATEVAGKGITAYMGASKILAGRSDFLESEGVAIDASLHAGKTATHIARDGKYLGCVTFADTLRTNSRATLKQLKKLGVKDLVMLTGDYEPTANAIAAKVGITQVHAQLLPADKLKIMKTLPIRPVMMVGDGVNDAPVLAASDIGVAMGARGATAASESADAVVMLDDISRVALVVGIAQRTMRIATQSVLIGIFLSVILMVIASLGYIPAVVGAGLQEIIDIVVIVNALRAHRG